VTADAGRRVLARLGVNFYPGEARLAWPLFTSFFLCVTFHYVCKTVRQSTYIDELGATNLPYAYLLLALLSYPVAKFYGWLATRVTRHQLAAGTFAFTAATLIVFWRLFATPSTAVTMAFYVWIGIAVALTLSQLWSLASAVFDARQAKRLFGFLGAGALLGGIAGGLTARSVAQVAETRDSLLVAALLLAPVVFFIYRLRAAEVAGAGLPAAPSTAGITARDALATVLHSQQLRLLAILITVVIVVSQIVDLQFNWAVEASTTNLADRTAFFGTFFSLMGVAAFAFQLLFTSRIHRLLGVGFALRVLPSSMGLGTVGLFVAAAFSPAALIVVALALKIAESGIRYSIDDSTRELLFLPVPAAERAKAKTFLDLFVKRAAKGLAALLLFPVTLGWITPLQAGWFSLAIIAGWLALTWLITREYVRSFRQGLAQKSVDSDSPINLADVTTLEILIESLGSPDPRQVLHGLEILSAHGRGRLVPPLLLYHEDEEVRCRTLQILAAQGREDAAPLVERRLSDASSAVRAEATRVLAHLRHQDACEMMLPRLESADAGVRAAAIACLANHGDPAMQQRAEEALKDMTSDAHTTIRIEGLRALGAIPEPLFTSKIIRLLYDPAPEVVRAAIQAVKRRVSRDGVNPLYLPKLTSLLANRRLKHDAREALVAFGDRAIPALEMFMNDPEEPLWVRRAIPKTIAGISSLEAADALLNSLPDPTDAFLRCKLLEALESLAFEPDGAERQQKIRREIRVEAASYLVVLGDLDALDSVAAIAVDAFEPDVAAASGPLLARLLAERAAEHRTNLFRLLALIYDRQPLWDAFRGLQRRALRANAIEFLDCTLGNEDKTIVLAAVGDAPLQDKLSRAERQFGIARSSKVATLLKHLSPRDRRTTDSPHLMVGALHTVLTEEIVDLYPVVHSLCATATDPFVLETAAWVSRQARGAGQDIHDA
jgi:AAA family ATP:ADP antiporter